MYSSPYNWTPCSKGMNADAPSATYAPTLTVRQRSVLNLGIQIKAAVADPESKI